MLNIDEKWIIKGWRERCVESKNSSIINFKRKRGRVDKNKFFFK